MDFSKQYILQAISIASNNLRLSSDKIETVAILRDHIQHCERLENDILNMKAKTELSKFAIKLWDAYQYTKSTNIDFLRIGEVFKEHSHNLVMELSNLLDVATPEKLNDILNSMEEKEEISVELGSQISMSEMASSIPHNKFGVEEEEEQTKESVERDELKEEFILSEIKEPKSFDFDDFEEEILKPIGKLEKLLVSILGKSASDNEIAKYIKIMKSNADFSKEIGFTILAEMHTIFFNALILISEEKIISDKNLIESLRACLIVIVAVVRGKDVDITNYLNKAENLGKYLKIN